MSHGRGLVVYEGLVCPLEVSVAISTGVGEVSVSGPITEEFEHVFQNAFNASCLLAEWGEFPLPNFAIRNLHIGITTSVGAPIGGQCYGLLLAIVLAGAYCGRSPRDSIAITGGIDENGEVLPVGDIDTKRSHAAEAGVSILMLPASQLDFFNRTIDQIPVATVFEAWSVLRYGR